ncbi:energy-coupling factor transporter transmembrane component T family protein [Nocardioides marmotae]|uniref:energy-coupling factor transporter transmembrane component T family protein n=1 Tax=Nocardioides marmotae TaxID=2663857 RepID=UPI0012B5F343|nr:energy-coupling factor transporter transmembrane component T [Nocardioides marmotae]MBC9735005.1 energy-coupling factor transporter transmembrane protein EcfT [Nocardioides marmotae]MTB86104.1 energy-coupling factor transporter transmembrane protein EcfT [Nocardioides marmotae]
MTARTVPATGSGGGVRGVRARARAARLPRDLHPVAWYAWAIGLATAASSTTNPLVLGLLLAVATLVVVARRSDQPWAASFRLYLWLALFVLVLRVVFRIVFGGSYPGTVLLDLPEIPLPDWVLGVRLLGPLTQEGLLSGVYDGLRLATIIVCIGAANALANPKRLLRSVPPALHEVGTALVVAVTVLPQLADSVRRVRAAQQLRAGEERRVRGLRRVLVPVLEDALERSLALAAGMDARGYGRAPGQTRRERWTTGALLLVGLGGICVGVYGVLDQTAPRVLAAPMLVLGVVVAVAGLVSAGRRVDRTRYRADRWRWPELVVVASGVVVGAVGVWAARNQVPIAYPDLTRVPEISLALLLGVLVGALAAVVAPEPRTVAA